MKKRNNRIGIYLSAMIIALSILVLAGVILYVFGPSSTLNSEGNNTPSITDTEDFSIETDYGLLYYPKKWEDSVDVEIEENVPYTVKFIAKVYEKGSYPLFDIVFDGQAPAVGVITTSDEKEVTVSVSNHEVMFDDTWSEEERIMISTMQEDVNHLLSRLLN